jgi:hypothetical protein
VRYRDLRYAKALINNDHFNALGFLKVNAPVCRYRKW